MCFIATSGPTAPPPPLPPPQKKAKPGYKMCLQTGFWLDYPTTPFGSCQPIVACTPHARAHAIVQRSVKDQISSRRLDPAVSKLKRPPPVTPLYPGALPSSSLPRPNRLTCPGLGRPSFIKGSQLSRKKTGRPPVELKEIPLENCHVQPSPGEGVPGRRGCIFKAGDGRDCKY